MYQFPSILSEQKPIERGTNIPTPRQHFDILSDANIETKLTLELLLKLRYGALVVQCLVIWPALKLGSLSTEYLAPYCIVVTMLCLLAICTNYALKFRKISATHAFLFFQLGIDTLALSLLLKFSGALGSREEVC
jgi:hypothetical protein